MPRPRRARNSVSTTKGKASEPLSDVDHAEEERGRAQGLAKATRSMRWRMSLGEEDAVRAADQLRDNALDRLANEDATTTTSGQTVGNDTSSIEMGRRARATPVTHRDTTGLDLADDDVFGDLDDSFADDDVPPCGRSAEDTSMSLGHFRPRSRQSSIVGRSDAPIRPSSRGPNTPGIGSSFNFGVFRRRAREPSILGTSRKPRSEDGGATHNSELESEGEFEPEAESTPLNNRRRRRGSEQLMSDEPSAELLSKKRKSVEAHDDDSLRPEKISRIGSDPGQEADSDSAMSEIASPSLPSTPGASRQRPMTLANQDEVGAPPASSDSEGEADTWPDIHTLANKRRRPSVSTPFQANNFSDMSSPPSLTHSPNYAEERLPRRRGRAATRHHENITTADLTNLLPKRRGKKLDDAFNTDSDEELDTASLGQDDDELSYLGARAGQRTRRGRTRGRTGSRGGRNRSALKANQTANQVRGSARSGKTHDRRRPDENESEDENDKENDEGLSAFVPLPEDTFDMDAGEDATGENVASTEELRQAAKKFVEVDKWELEFEEVTEVSSPQDAR
ncbi:hypothetical protein DCS_04819 [Drechmeria coniospora]|uniref:Uncharacterized protein n=1 Tax=Drechmeria coniospora TaxID=98403 RepID=A0A151GL43_DRECN|nr:hypothetical protein DCS_04819 [Drechmeria coniospora]KYK57806.1 hypothetical protein DCS_04819 [Drechmeria coniospora]